MSATIFRRALREPLLHFLIVGSLIFAVSHAVEAARRAQEIGRAHV